MSQSSNDVFQGQAMVYDKVK